jgi:hypothetical protein
MAATKWWSQLWWRAGEWSFLWGHSLHVSIMSLQLSWLGMSVCMKNQLLHENFLNSHIIRFCLQICILVWNSKFSSWCLNPEAFPPYLLLTAMVWCTSPVGVCSQPSLFIKMVLSVWSEFYPKWLPQALQVIVSVWNYYIVLKLGNKWRVLK